MPESARWWRARARAIVTDVVLGFDGREGPKALRQRLRTAYRRHARRAAPASTRQIWYQEIARAFGCGGARSIPDARRRMKQLGLPLPTVWIVRP